jgi:hypothetical protein
MWHVLYDYPKKELAVTFGCTFHNRHVGEIAQFLGRDMSLEASPSICRTYAAEWKPEFGATMSAARQKSAQIGLAPQDAVVVPDYSIKQDEVKVTSHMANFIECARSRALPRCGVDRAFQEAVALLMSVEAFRRERKVRWDVQKEEII